MNLKGRGCSISGRNYELDVYNIVKKCTLNGNIFNTQDENELGGCSSKNDIDCNMNALQDISIEIKKSNTPDWMQCSLHPISNNINTKWVGSLKNNKGFCKLSVTIACLPKNIKNLIYSQYSLDNKLKLPANLVYS